MGKRRAGRNANASKTDANRRVLRGVPDPYHGRVARAAVRPGRLASRPDRPAAVRMEASRRNPALSDRLHFHSAQGGKDHAGRGPGAVCPVLRWRAWRAGNQRCSGSRAGRTMFRHGAANGRRGAGAVEPERGVQAIPGHCRDGQQLPRAVQRCLHQARPKPVLHRRGRIALLAGPRSLGHAQHVDGAHAGNP
jgi:hypothetical protein